MIREEFEKLSKHILQFLASAKYEKKKVSKATLYREFPEYSQKDIDFVLWYLQEKGLVKGCEITAEGYDALGA